jgi:hypothetical protein
MEKSLCPSKACTPKSYASPSKGEACGHRERIGNRAWFSVCACVCLRFGGRALAFWSVQGGHPPICPLLWQCGLLVLLLRSNFDPNLVNDLGNVHGTRLLHPRLVAWIVPAREDRSTKASVRFNCVNRMFDLLVFIPDVLAGGSNGKSNRSICTAV